MAKIDEEMSEAKITIDPEFKKLIPAMPQDILVGLEKSLLRDGLREPLAVWDHEGQLILLDGHHRYEICLKHNIEIVTTSIELANREEAINWIIDNQLGRRNLNEAQRDYLIGKKYNLAKKAEGGDKKSDEYKKSLGQSDQVVSTAQKLGDKEGVGEKTVRRAGQYSQAIDDLMEESPDFAKKALADPKKIPKKWVIAIAKMEPEDQIEAIAKVEAGTFKLAPKAELEPELPQAEPEQTETPKPKKPEQQTTTRLNVTDEPPVVPKKLVVEFEKLTERDKLFTFAA